MQLDKKGQNHRPYIHWRLLILALAGCAPGIQPGDEKELRTALEHYRAREFDRSRTLTRELIQEHPDWVAPRLLDAKILFFTRRFTEAEEAFQTIIEQKGHHPEAMRWLARTALVQQKSPEQARSILENVVARNPEDIQAHYLLGRCAEKSGNLKKAILHYKRSTSSYPSLSKSHLHLGKLLERQGLRHRAVAQFRKVEQLGLKDHVRKARESLTRLKAKESTDED